METALVAPHPLKLWVLAIRPKTLVAGLIPVLLGDALAAREAQHSFSKLLAPLAWTLLIQIACNLNNDYYDFKRGADTAERLGPVRVTQSGLMTPEMVLMGTLAFFGAAILVGLHLTSQLGLPALGLVGVSVLTAHAYTGGPFPLGYNGLGDVAVFIFFGLVPVALTYYVETLRLTPLVWAIALVPGFLGMAILAVNNVRDAATDARAGKRTLVVLLGTRFGRAQYATVLILAVLVPVALWLSGQVGPTILLTLLALPLARVPLTRMLRDSGAVLNEALAETARFELVFGLLMTLGLWLDSRV
jgi:1,4-dihydroxy-2-naphthoate polyprenyltransferase